jgi:hypothetical protein
MTTNRTNKIQRHSTMQVIPAPPGSAWAYRVADESNEEWWLEEPLDFLVLAKCEEYVQKGDEWPPKKIDHTPNELITLLPMPWTEDFGFSVVDEEDAGGYLWHSGTGASKTAMYERLTSDGYIRVPETTLEPAAWKRDAPRPA